MPSTFVEIQKTQALTVSASAGRLVMGLPQGHKSQSLSRVAFAAALGLTILLASCAGGHSSDHRSGTAESSARPVCMADPVLRPHTPIGKLTQQVIEGSCTDRDKAQKIYDWIAHNIAYDAQSHWSSVLRSQTPEEVLNSRLAVCDGYASLFQAMAEQSRLKSKKLYGMAKTAQEAQSFVKGKPNHAWNMVHFDGKWHFIDSTWGAGYTTRGKGFVREYRPQYFSLDPQSALLTHWDLEDSFGVQKQFNLSFEEFIRLPRPQTEISRLGFGPEMQLRLARLKSPAPLVTVYEGAEDYLSSDDPRALNRNLPREGYSFNLRLKKPSSLFLYANEQFLQIVHDNQNAVVHVPARMRGDIVLMAQIGPGEFRGLLEYHRP